MRSGHALELAGETESWRGRYADLQDQLAALQLTLTSTSQGMDAEIDRLKHQLAVDAEAAARVCDRVPVCGGV